MYSIEYSLYIYWIYWIYLTSFISFDFQHYPIDKDKFTLQERRDIVEPFLDNFVSKDKVCAGYMVKYDKTFIHPLDYGEGMENDIIGLVAKVTDDNVYVISLHVNRCQYAYEPCDKAKLKDEDKYFYPAIDFCKEYSTWGTKKGE